MTPAADVVRARNTDAPKIPRFQPLPARSGPGNRYQRLASLLHRTVGRPTTLHAELFPDRRPSTNALDRCTVSAAVSSSLSTLLGRKCEEYADRLIAHHDTRGVAVLSTYRELDDALKFLDDLLIKYTPMLRADSLAQVAPFFADDWRSVFEQPWTLPRDAGTRSS